MDQPSPTDDAPTRSAVVTVIAFMFGSYQAVGLVGSVGQLVAFSKLDADFGASLILLPAIMIPWWGIELAATIGLYLRRPRARRAFIALRVINVALMLMGCLASLLMVLASPLGAGELVLLGVGTVLMLTIAGFFLWVIRRLRSPQIVAEFA